MAVFQPPPTWAMPILVDEKTGKNSFNPVWLKWFVDFIAIINATGGGSIVLHNATGGLQGGTANQYYHLTAAQDSLVAGITATAAEINILDGVTASTAEINILDGVTATTAEINILDGVTATTAQINKLAVGLSVVIATAKLTGLGANGSMTFTNGVLTAQTAAT